MSEIIIRKIPQTDSDYYIVDVSRKDRCRIYVLQSPNGAMASVLRYIVTHESERVISTTFIGYTIKDGK